MMEDLHSKKGVTYMQRIVKNLIDHFHFSYLPAEGMLFSSTWRSIQEFPDGSPLGTAMIGMYCHDPLSQSLFHRLPVDETWHFYGGDPLRLILLFPDGSSRDMISRSSA
jgi:predicted cupin superfamily sugar epimerase